ncbi:MAG: hypothetical protein WDM70_03340 [Nitrosomonadales bacterium]
MITDQVDKALREIIPEQELASNIDNIGLPYSGINLSYSKLWNDRHTGCRNSDIA